MKLQCPNCNSRLVILAATMTSTNHNMAFYCWFCDEISHQIEPNQNQHHAHDLLLLKTANSAEALEEIRRAVEHLNQTPPDIDKNHLSN